MKLKKAQADERNALAEKLYVESVAYEDHSDNPGTLRILAARAFAAADVFIEVTYGKTLAATKLQPHPGPCPDCGY